MPVFRFTQRHNATTFLYPRCGVMALCGITPYARVVFSLLLLALLLPSCTVFKSRDTRSALKIKREVAHSPIFSKAFTGFTLLDPTTGATLADFNGDHYFIPASNTKILTLATCLEVLGDSVPGVQYAYPYNGIVFRGTGDPTFLHPKFEAWQKARRLLYRPPVDLLYIHRRFDEGRFGAGWAWDDFNEGYQVERSAMPIYGNCIQVIGRLNGDFHVEPTFFNPFFRRNWQVEASTKTRRSEEHNYWVVDSFPALTAQTLPFRTASKCLPLVEHFSPDESHYFEQPRTLLIELLSDTLKRTVQELCYDAFPELESPTYPWRTLYSTPIDTVLRRMMHQSDNFIAEQMLMVCAGVKFDLLKQDTLVKWMLDSTLNSLPQRPKWVDGSGLSRYNLMTPQSIGQVLLKLWREQPHERILSLFPAGGISGTISDWYAGKDGKPYVFAKTGGMGGVQCLSGYVVCNSGKVLIFSFMHNNFVGSNRAWKLEMQRLLEQIRDRF
ncbi:MAG: D-alanyl-D-alanine carboxypeptidase [Saprospiraceae bacterium]|jgi:D-alanyl-D-alanine carboxypeptidase/D-alanyl-D-alanine-endopeptidase (penicillin-binding protein 4)|nr:D-alanyl-D-alanine carboxypeptidase [Saprospiraceae bacterium]